MLSIRLLASRISVCARSADRQTLPSTSRSYEAMIFQHFKRIAVRLDDNPSGNTAEDDPNHRHVPANLESISCVAETPAGTAKNDFARRRMDRYYLCEEKPHKQECGKSNEFLRQHCIAMDSEHSCGVAAVLDTCHRQAVKRRNHHKQLPPSVFEDRRCSVGVFE